MNTAFLMNVGLQFAFSCLITFVFSLQRICQDFHFVLDKDVINDHALDGHVFQRHSLKRATQCHVMCKDNCRCISINYLPTERANNCELNDENKERKPDALKYKLKAQYYGLVRNYTAEVRNEIKG